MDAARRRYVNCQNTINFRIKVLLLFSFILMHIPVFSHSVDEYESRRHNYLLLANSSNKTSTLIVQSYLGLPLNQMVLNQALANIDNKKGADFEINQLIRVLFYTDESKEKILNTLKKQAFWLTSGERKNQYWSENHMILWMSSAWLLHEKFGWELPDATLHERLLHFLNLKVTYGFYEFFSPVYFPYLLSGLLNLSDFAKDKHIQQLAEQAVLKLIHASLLFVNDKGVFFPAAGRAYPNKYKDAYSHNHAHLIYLITGLGEMPTKLSQIGSFIATTHVNLSDVIAAFQAHVDQIIFNGHALSNQVHHSLNRFDRTLFQWSSGAYFHPDVIEDTLWLIDTMDLWQHDAFKAYFKGNPFPSYVAKLAAEKISSVTKSSLINQSRVALYKNKGVVLSSIQNFWPGSLGYQQWPWVAAIDELAVWTQSGVISEDNVRLKHSFSNNSSLPYLKQKSNVLLIMYKANDDLRWMMHPDNSVMLHWPIPFDQTLERGKWVIGQRGSSYIAVYKPCEGQIKGFYACNNQAAQTWAVIVGNELTYGDFDLFVRAVEETHVEEKWIWDWRKCRYHYYGIIKHRDIKIEKTWSVPY